LIDFSLGTKKGDAKIVRWASVLFELWEHWTSTEPI